LHIRYAGLSRSFIYFNSSAMILLHDGDFFGGGLFIRIAPRHNFLTHSRALE